MIAEAFTHTGLLEKPTLFMSPTVIRVDKYAGVLISEEQMSEIMGKFFQTRFDTITRLENGYRQILELSDVEMADGDGARAIAREQLNLP